MAPRFQDKVCLITGAASGIGRATAIKLASEGAKLALCDINRTGLEDTHRACGEGHYIEVVDVRSSAASGDFVRNVIGTIGRLDSVSDTTSTHPFTSSLDFDTAVHT